MGTPRPNSNELAALYGRPGFMIRRAHQIATSIFLEASAELRTTTTQYGVLTILQFHPGVDQITVARLLGLDRSTTGSVLRTLEAAGHVRRLVGPDRRRRSLQLTEAGASHLAELHGRAAVAVDRLLEPLGTDERSTFLGLLAKLTAAHNSGSRVPMSVQVG